MKYFNISVLLILLLFLSSNIQSSPLQFVPCELKQPDGTILYCFASGDEFFNWLHDKDGYTIVKNPITNYWVYAKKYGKTISCTDYIPGKVNPFSMGLTKYILPDREEQKIVIDKRRTLLNKEITEKAAIRKLYKNYNGIQKGLTDGTLNNLVIFIRFADSPEYDQPLSEFQKMFNDIGDDSNSLRSFYKTNSYNQLNIESHFYPSPNVQNIVSYKDSHIRDYYISKDIADSGFIDLNDGLDRLRFMLKKALASIAPMVPQDINLDLDDDGYIDNITYILSGQPDTGLPLWPHAGWLGVNNFMINGKNCGVYNLQLVPWLNKYVICHEFFHILGAPDLYHYFNQGQPIGDWDLMSGGNIMISSYMRYKYGKWLSNLPEINRKGEYKLNALAKDDSTNVFYKIRSPYSDDEYFVFEYRDEIKDHEGLLIYRIKSSLYGNSDGPPDEVYVYRPNGDLRIEGNLDDAPFSQFNNSIEFNDYTNPSSFLSDGNMGGLKISGIKIDKTERTALFIVDTLYPKIVEKVFPNFIINLTDSDIGTDKLFEYTIKASDKNNSIIKYSVLKGPEELKVDGMTGKINWTPKKSDLGGPHEVSIRAVNVTGGSDTTTAKFQVKLSTNYNGWKYFTQFNSGLPDNNDYDIATEKNGIMWVGTASGVAKFDGTDWTVYNISNSGIPYNEVYTIAIDGSGNKWIACGPYGLAKFDGTNWVRYYPSNNGYPGNINSMAIDVSGIKWIGIDKSVVKFDGTSWTAYNANNSVLPNAYVQSIAIDKNGIKWIGTQSGVVKFDGANWTVYNTSNSGLQSNDILAITTDINDNKWIGTRAGVAKFDGTNWTTYNTSNSGLSGNFITTIEIDGSGNKWIGTEAGVVKFDGSNWTVYNTSNSGIISNDIRNIAIDKNDNIFMGSNGEGLAVLNEGLILGIPESTKLPKEFTLYQNYPNPFNHSTKISFDLSQRTSIKLILYDIFGREVKILIDDVLNGGYHEITFDGSNLNSGVYFYKLSTANFTSAKKLLLIK